MTGGKGNNMEWIDRLNQAVAYIEDHLTTEIDVEKTAQIAVCSSYHFQRMFTYIAGVTLGEYIRRRRMTAAAFELLHSEVKIIDIAAKYGYESPTAFTRAFQNIHGIAPSAAKKRGVSLTAYPRITFTLSIKGDEAMNYKIEHLDDLRIVGIGTKEPKTVEECFALIPHFWQKRIADGTTEKILSLLDSSGPAALLGVSLCEDNAFSGYYIAVVTKKPCPPEMEELIIPAGTWAIFTCIGAMPDAMQKLQQRIVSEWLPNSGYEYAFAPDIEVYYEGDQFDDDYRSEVWLPVVKKEKE